MEQNAICKVLLALLNDDNGISEDAYKALRELIDSEFTIIPLAVRDILNRVEATDGRFYLPEGV